jgi:DNA-binding XRE family transcriptional regulator
VVRDPQTLGERLALVRNRHGMTQWQMSQVVGVSRQDVTDYEHGQEVPLPVLVMVGEVFGVRWLWLADGLGAREQQARCGWFDGL